jgi:hypothetical protein
MTAASREPARGAAAAYVAARHILESPSIATRTAPYLGATSFDWAGLAAAASTMSVGERLLVEVAHDLWEAGGSVRLRDVTRRLDGRAFDRVVEALYASRGESLPKAA